MYEVRGFVVFSTGYCDTSDVMARLEQMSAGRFTLGAHVQNGMVGLSIFSFGNHGAARHIALAEMANYLGSLPIGAEGFIQYADDELNENHVFEIEDVMACANTLGAGNASKTQVHRCSASPTPD
jgi:hypothetical protein